MEIQSLKRGEDSNVQLSLTAIQPFEGEATAILRGLSDNLKSGKIKFNSKTKSILIPLEVKDKARLGEHKNMFLSMSIPYKGKTLPQNIATGGVIRVDEPAKKTVAKADSKKPADKKSPSPRKLSRLEELRLLKEEGAKK